MIQTIRRAIVGARCAGQERQRIGISMRRTTTTCMIVTVIVIIIVIAMVMIMVSIIMSTVGIVIQRAIMKNPFRLMMWMLLLLL